VRASLEDYFLEQLNAPAESSHALSANESEASPSAAARPRS